MATRIDYNCTTGVQTVREETAEELEEREAGQAAYELQVAADEAAGEATVAARASAEAKLVELGLSADEIAALVG
jgi:hypothetical protein